MVERETIIHLKPQTINQKLTAILISQIKSPIFMAINTKFRF